MLPPKSDFRSFVQIENKMMKCLASAFEKVVLIPYWIPLSVYTGTSKCYNCVREV